MNVNPTADNVPIGMLRPGLFNSPLILAPAMIPGRRANRIKVVNVKGCVADYVLIPVTPEKSTPKTIANVTWLPPAE